MKPIYKVLEGLLDIDDVETGMMRSIASKRWNKMLAAIKLAYESKAMKDLLTHDLLCGYVKEVAGIIGLKSSRNWPVKSSWERTPDFMLISDNAVIIKNDKSMYIDIRGEEGHFVKFCSESFGDNLEYKFYKDGNERYVNVEVAHDHYIDLGIGKIRQVYILPTDIFNESFCTVFKMWKLPYSQVLRVYKEGYDPNN